MRSSRIKRNRNFNKLLLKRRVITREPEQSFIEDVGDFNYQFQPKIVNLKNENFNIYHKLSEISLELELLEQEIQYKVDLTKVTLFQSPFEVKNVLKFFSVFDDIFVKVHQIHFEVQNNSFDVTNI